MKYIWTIIFILVPALVFAQGRFIGETWVPDTSFTANDFNFSNNVGIGTTSIPGKLIIKGNGTTTGITFQTKDSSAAIKTTILDNGNLGLGTSVPTTKLQVTGTATATAFVGPLTGAVTGNVTGNLTGAVTGNASTSTALAANGTNCLAGLYPIGVDASGTSESCTTTISQYFVQTNIDAKTTGTTLLGTTENAGRRFYGIYAILSVRSVNTLTGPPTVSIGTNNPDYNNVVSDTLITSMPSAFQFLRLNVDDGGLSVAPNTAIYLNISSGATATTYQIDVSLYGYYQ